LQEYKGILSFTIKPSPYKFHLLSKESTPFRTTISTSSASVSTLSNEWPRVQYDFLHDLFVKRQLVDKGCPGTQSSPSSANFWRIPNTHEAVATAA